MSPDPTDPQSLPRTMSVIEEWAATGHHIGAQVYVSIDARPVADFAWGWARPVLNDTPAVPMTRDTLMVWLSACKPFAAVALAQLREKGLLDYADRVAKFVPEFAAAGKDAITLTHLLTHTAGLRFVELGWPEAPWGQIIASICAAPLEPGWTPGEKAGYSPFASWFILAEVIRRLDPVHRAYAQYCHEEIFLPLGMADSYLALAPKMYRAYGDRIGMLMNTYKKPMEPTGLDTEVAAAACRPSGGGRGPAWQLGRFYEGLLQSMKSNSQHPLAAEIAVHSAAPRKALLQPASLFELTRPHRIGLFDHTFRHVMDWGLGFITNSAPHGPDTVPYATAPDPAPAHSGTAAHKAPAPLPTPTVRWSSLSPGTDNPANRPTIDGSVQHSRRWKKTWRERRAMACQHCAAARSNSALASSRRPSFNSKSPRTVGSEW